MRRLTISLKVVIESGIEIYNITLSFLSNNSLKKTTFLPFMSDWRMINFLHNNNFTKISFVLSLKELEHIWCQMIIYDMVLNFLIIHKNKHIKALLLLILRFIFISVIIFVFIFFTSSFILFFLFTSVVIVRLIFGMILFFKILKFLKKPIFLRFNRFWWIVFRWLVLIFHFLLLFFVLCFLLISICFIKLLFNLWFWFFLFILRIVRFIIVVCVIRVGCAFYLRLLDFSFRGSRCIYWSFLSLLLKLLFFSCWKKIFRASCSLLLFGDSFICFIDKIWFNLDRSRWMREFRGIRTVNHLNIQIGDRRGSTLWSWNRILMRFLCLSLAN